VSDLPVAPQDRSPVDDSLWATWELLRIAKFEEDIQPTISCGKAMELIESLVASRLALAEANKEIQRLKVELYEPLLKDMRFENGELDMRICGRAVEEIGAAFIAYVKEQGGENYVEMQFHDRDEPGAVYTVTTQRPKGKTPHQLRAEAEERLAAMKRHLNHDDIRAVLMSLPITEMCARTSDGNAVLTFAFGVQDEYGIYPLIVTRKTDDLVINLRQTIKDLLLSSDCSWESRSSGHDWPAAVQKARDVLFETRPPNTSRLP
jgi:hypothetical protein